MPGYNRDALSVEFQVVTSALGREPPRAQLEAALRAAGKSGLAHESGPGTTVLSGARGEVLGAMVEVIEAALDAGAGTVKIKVEAEGDASRFQSN